MQQCEMKAGDPCALVVVIANVFSFLPSLLSLSVNEIVLKQLTATLPGLVSLEVAFLSHLKCGNASRKLQHLCAVFPHHRGVLLGRDAHGQIKAVPFGVVPQLQASSTAPKSFTASQLLPNATQHFSAWDLG